MTRLGGGLVHDLHSILAIVLGFALAGLVVALARGALRLHGRAGAVLLTVAAVLIAAAFAARSSGHELPWNALALSLVKVNSRYDGVWKAAFDPVVRFVLTDREVQQWDYRVSVVAHLFAAPTLLGTGLAVALAFTRPRRDDK